MSTRPCHRQRGSSSADFSISFRNASDSTAILRFVREARLGGSLNHPNIVTVYEYFEHGGIPYIAMEFLARGPLRPLVGALTVSQVVGVLEGILSGLAHANEHGIVHRDLKPENVLRTDDGGVKIADFGIARAYDELSSTNLTPAGEFVGAAAYVSPEQALGASATAVSDVYAVGVIAFELFTGSVPFADAGSASSLLIQKVNQRAPTLRSGRPDVDKRFADWTDRLLERDPSRRPESAKAARESLEDAAEAAIGARWHRTAALPPGEPGREPLGSPDAPPHRFASTRTIRTHAPTRVLLANALAKPANLLVAVGVAIAAVFFTSWLFVVAGGVYLALAAITFFDEAEAARVGSRSNAASTPEPVEPRPG